MGVLFQEGSFKNKCISPEKTETWRGVLWQAVCYFHEQRELDPRKEEVGQGWTREGRDQQDEARASDLGPKEQKCAQRPM